MMGSASIPTQGALHVQFAGLMKQAPPPRIILGSASSSRRQIMEELLSPFDTAYEVCTADIDEKAIRKADPRELVVVLAHAKAAAIKQKLQSNGNSTSGFLITCDQVVVHEGRILEKPESTQEAREFIAGYARAPASTVGSVLCTDLSTGKLYEGVDTAFIHFNPIPENVVDQLLEQGDCMYCAGGLMVEHPLVAPYVTKIEGTKDSVMGLSKALVMDLLLRAAGILPDSGSTV